MEQMQIRVNTDVLAEKADFAEKKIQVVRSRFEQIDQIVKGSGSYWEGDANAAHIREFLDYQDDISEILERFQENVTDLRKIAGIYDVAERTVTEYGGDLPENVIS